MMGSMIVLGKKNNRVTVNNKWRTRSMFLTRGSRDGDGILKKMICIEMGIVSLSFIYTMTLGLVEDRVHSGVVI